MQLLESVHLVQFFLFEAQTLHFDATTAIIAPNGAGKSAILDALQIVLLGGDRNRIRFNAQAGGTLRARSIRDYCLGVYRSGEDGRKRRTANTYISLVFRDQESGLPLTAGIALGASAEESEHRLHGMYIAQGVALELEDHLEHVRGKELPLGWSAFRELLVRRCKDAGSTPELHNASERFVRDLLFRLRAAPTAHPDINAYRKAFQNALNLQKQEDIDLWVRSLVAEDRPTDIARFRGLLDTFRQIKEKIEQVVRRIDAAEGVEKQYAKVQAQAVRSASYRALGAEYARDLLAEQVERAEKSVAEAEDRLAETSRRAQQMRVELAAQRDEHEQARVRLQSSQGYGEQASFDELAARDRDGLRKLKQLVLRDVRQLREAFAALEKLALPTVDVSLMASVKAAWQHLHDALATIEADAPLPWTPEQLHELVRANIEKARPLLQAANAYARERHNALAKADERVRLAKENKARLAAGQAELQPDTIRLLNYLRDEGIEAKPVCDLVSVKDPTWQASIEAYLRSNVEALLIPQEKEEAAVRLYRSLQGNRSVYGVKLALGSHARQSRPARPDPNSVAALLEGENPDAVAFLRRQLGELLCVESDAELVRTRQGLTRDGLLAKGGSVERLRLPAVQDLKIGAKDNRARLRGLHEELETALADQRHLKASVQLAEACLQALAPATDAVAVAQSFHDQGLEHRSLEQRYRAAEENRSAALNPDLLRLSQQVQQAGEKVAALEARWSKLLGDERESQNNVDAARRLLEGLQAQEEKVVARAVEAFRHPDVDPNRVERQREDLDAKVSTLEERIRRCESRDQDSQKELQRLVPEAWTGLQQYAKDHGFQFDFAADEWRRASAFLGKELTHLRDTELVRYRGDADRAYGTAVETFRASVASTLFDNFTKLKHQIDRLNRTLRSSPAFSNNERYRFHYEVVPEFRDLHKFIQRAAELNGEDTLFGSAGEVPAAFRDLIEESAVARVGSSPLDDYRRFFRFEVQIRQDERVIGTLSERMRSGSGGEHRAPLYVIAGAALAAAYGKSEAHPGGLGLILLDEFGDKIDAQNARATTNYLRSLGLQLLVAAPDTAQGTLSGVLDSYIELFRDDDLIQVERVEVSAAARDLLVSDQFDLHPELLAAETARVTAGQASV